MRSQAAKQLAGRSREFGVLDRYVEAVGAGEGRALVVRGELGVGKTALLEYVVERASGFRVVRAAGVQSEMELAFSGLHQLLAPMLDRLERLPRPQRDALQTAFGLGPASAPGRLFVGLAVLGLFSEVAEERPLICVVDDEQWLDRASAQVLAFVARRLEAESVALIFAARGSSDDLVGLPELVVGGLPEGDALSNPAIATRLFISPRTVKYQPSQDLPQARHQRAHRARTCPARVGHASIDLAVERHQDRERGRDAPGAFRIRRWSVVADRGSRPGDRTVQWRMRAGPARPTLAG